MQQSIKWKGKERKRELFLEFREENKSFRKEKPSFFFFFPKMICDEKVKGKLKTEERSLFDTFIETSVKIWLTFGQIFYDIFETLFKDFEYNLISILTRNELFKLPSSCRGC